jgi:hypothetical protein
VRTDELLALLATRNDAADRRLPLRRLSVAVLAGTAIATLLTAECLGLRSTLVGDLSAPPFWVKETFCTALGAAGVVAVARLGRPGSRLVGVWMGVAAPLVAMWLLAALTLLWVDAGHRTDLVLGHTANVCSVRIALISIPLLVGMLLAMKGLAPTRLRLAGAAVGFAAGSLGALVYSLHCPELEPAFVGLWYVLGVLIPTATGAAAGPRLLRW